MKAISFLNAEKCEYAYYLEGYDKAWHIAGYRPEKLFTVIFRPVIIHCILKWSNGDGIWTNEMPLLNLEVKQYFWLTTYAFLVYALIVFSPCLYVFIFTGKINWK